MDAFWIEIASYTVYRTVGISAANVRIQSCSADCAETTDAAAAASEPTVCGDVRAHMGRAVWRHVGRLVWMETIHGGVLQQFRGQAFVYIYCMDYFLLYFSLDLNFVICKNISRARSISHSQLLHAHCRRAGHECGKLV